MPSLGRGLRTHSVGSNRQEHDWHIDLALVPKTHLAGAHSIFDAVARLGFWVLVVEVASLFAEPLNVGFGLLAGWVNRLANLGDALVLATWLYIDDETLFVGGANDPPIGESRTGKGEQESAYHHKPAYRKGPVQPPTSPLLPRLSLMRTGDTHFA